ncbi:hypothetical protein ACFL21_00015 [Patescibacteria group bacterium]
MKKMFAVIIGVIVGIACSVGVISYKNQNVARGAITFWDEAVAFGDLFDWKDIFTPSETPTDLYKLIYSKLFVQPERDSINQLALNYGYTSDEAQRIIDGSITPIYRNPDRRGAILTQEQAYQAYEQMQTEFASYKEIFDLEQEINVAIAPTEIFANDDLSDSGFDLIHDLSVIEEILFVEVERNTLGDPFNMGLESPFVPTKEEKETYEELGGPEFTDDGEVFSAELERTEDGESDEDDLVKRTGSGDEEQEDSDEFDAEYRDEDVCDPQDELSKALQDFDEKQEAARESAASDGSGAGTGEVDGDTSGDSDGVGDISLVEAEEDSLVTEDGDILPAPEGEWGSAWCPSLGDVGGEGAAAAAGSSFGSAGFDSLGNTVNSLINQAAVAMAGVNVPGFSASVSICLDTDLKWKRVRSYIPGQSCIACEVDDINDVMNQTLHHSFVPNKVTGNLFESAKCKASLEVPLVDINFIALGIPIPTPPSDETIFGRNMFEEWNKFIERYEPFFGLKPQYDQDYLLEFELESAPQDTSISDAYNSVVSIRQKQTAEAMQTLENYSYSHHGKNNMLYSQVVLGEMRQMTAFFEHMKELYEDIDAKACQPIIKKPDIN